MQYTFAKHAIEQITKRNISRTIIEQVIKHPDKIIKHEDKV